MNIPLVACPLDTCIGFVLQQLVMGAQVRLGHEKNINIFKDSNS